MVNKVTPNSIFNVLGANQDVDKIATFNLFDPKQSTIFNQ